MSAELQVEGQLLDEMARLYKQISQVQRQMELYEIPLEVIIEHGDSSGAELVAVQARLSAILTERNQLLQAHNALFRQEKELREELLRHSRAMQAELADLRRENQRFQISLETITEHADLVENELLETKGFLETKVKERTQELEDKNRELQSEISERLRAEQSALQAKEAAERASRAKSFFLAKMSHELRTPLNAILGYSELLMEELEDRDQADLNHEVQAIHAAGKHLLTIIKDLLDISKIETDRIKLHPEKIAVSALMDHVVALTTPSLRGNRFSVSCAPSVGTMVCDAVRLQQILLNLLNNAIKFTSDGEISLTVKRREGFVEFCVGDTGIGISKDYLCTIFDAFTQVDNSYTRRYEGAGIGLTICKELCRLMGGEITVESQLGKGSVFTVRIPG